MHVSERFEGEIGYNLYKLNYFYVEVKYNGGINAITKFTSFNTYTKLEPCLDKIDISCITGMWAWSFVKHANNLSKNILN